MHHFFTLHDLQAKKAAEAVSKPPSKKAALLVDDSAEETDPTLYYENRVKTLAAKKSKGINPYPHKFEVSLSLPQFIEKYKDLEPGKQLTDVTVSVAGAEGGEVMLLTD
jgi:lysyl-tRNA synthetase class 2